MNRIGFYRRISLFAIVAVLLLAMSCSQPSAQPTAPAAAPKAPAATAGAGSTTSGSTAGKTTIKVASSGFVMPGGPEVQLSDDVIGLGAFDQALKKHTDKVDLQIFHGSVLGDQAAVLQGARLGVPAQMASGTLNNLYSYAPSAGFAVLPFIWKDYQQVLNIVPKIWDEMDQRFIKEAGVRVVTYYIAGWRDISNSKRPITRLDDLKGLKLRVPPSQLQVAIYKSWGVEPVAVPYAELYQSLQQNVIDGHDLNATAHYSGKFYEAQKYYTPLRYNPNLLAAVIGEQFYQSLPKDVQEAITKAGRESFPLAVAAVQKAEETSLRELEKAGLKFSELKDAPEWEKRARAIWPDFYDKVGGKELVDKIEKLKTTP